MLSNIASQSIILNKCVQNVVFLYYLSPNSSVCSFLRSVTKLAFLCLILYPWPHGWMQNRSFYKVRSFVNFASPVSFFRDRKIGGSRERRRIRAETVTPLSWPGWKEGGGVTVVGEVWLKLVELAFRHTFLHPPPPTWSHFLSIFFFKHELCVENEQFWGCVMWFLWTLTLPLCFFSSLIRADVFDPELATRLHVLVKLLVPC